VTGVQTCALPICSAVAVSGGGAVSAFEDMIKEHVDPYVEISNKIGGPVAEQVKKEGYWCCVSLFPRRNYSKRLLLVKKI